MKCQAAAGLRTGGDTEGSTVSKSQRTNWIRVLEAINLTVFGSIGAYVAALGLYSFLTEAYGTIDVVFGFYHPAATYIIAGCGLIALCFRWKLYGFPMFLIASNFVENAWLWYEPAWNSIQLILMLFGYVIASPQFKQPAWLLTVAILNLACGLSAFDYHHLAEAGIYAVLLLDVEKVSGPLSWKEFLSVFRDSD